MNKRIKQQAYALLALLFLTLSASAEEKTDSWLGFRGGPQLKGVAQSELPDKLERVWTFMTKGNVESTAAIHDGTVYVGSGDGKLYALHLSDGTEKWHFDAGSPVNSSPTYHEGALYFGSETGVFFAVRADNGGEIWRVETAGEIYSGALVIKGRVVFGSYDGYLRGVSIENGEELWKIETDNYIHASPASSDLGAVVAGCDGVLRAVDPITGAENLNLNLEDYIGSSAAVDGKTAFLASYGARALAIDLEKADILWEYKHPTRQFPFLASGALTEKMYLIGGRDKTIHAIDRKTGKPIWTKPVGSKIDSSPVTAGGRVFFGTAGGELTALRLTDGEIVWQYEIGADIVASPSVASNKLVIGAADGVVYCFGSLEKNEGNSDSR